MWAKSVVREEDESSWEAILGFFVSGWQDI
jgi:hypothetical protein